MCVDYFYNLSEEGGVSRKVSRGFGEPSWAKYGHGEEYRISNYVGFLVLSKHPQSSMMFNIHDFKLPLSFCGLKDQVSKTHDS